MSEEVKEVKEAIRHGFRWACRACYYADEKCPIQRLARKYDPNFRVGVFCEFDMELVINKMLKRLLDENKERS